MLNIGILGFGFMGRMHFNCYKKRNDIRIAAICDADLGRITDPKAAGNIPLEGNEFDLADIEIFADFDAMLDKVKLDALSITLPTFLHADFTCKALARGIHVLCEKPMSLDVAGCNRMIAAAEQSGKVLQIAHCVRFWPEYQKAKELVDSGIYGPVLAASFRRLSARPTWSQENWLGNVQRSGGMELDLHIHDTDYVQHLLGRPKSVHATGYRQPEGGFGHIVAQFNFDSGAAVYAEGGWLLQPSFGFEMSFNLVLEKATILFDSTRKPAFRVCPADGDAFTPEVAPGDGYTRQIDHFLRAARGETVPPIVTPSSSRDSIKIVDAERRSAETGQTVALDWA